MPAGIYPHKPHTKEWKIKMSIIAKNKRFGKWSKGKKHSEETKRKMSLSHPKGIKHHNWKGGQIMNSGYIHILQPNHPKGIKYGTQKYVKRCILVMEKHIGRFLKPEEIVHHKGIKYSIGNPLNKIDDRIENLQLFNNDLEHQQQVNHKKQAMKYLKFIKK